MASTTTVLLLTSASRLDVGLHDQMVEAVVAAEHDCDIGAGLVLSAKALSIAECAIWYLPSASRHAARPSSP